MHTKPEDVQIYGENLSGLNCCGRSVINEVLCRCNNLLDIPISSTDKLLKTINFKMNHPLFKPLYPTIDSLPKYLPQRPYCFQNNASDMFDERKEIRNMSETWNYNMILSVLDKMRTNPDRNLEEDEEENEGEDEGCVVPNSEED
ncbi:hypothetical protein HAX54_031602 [Datura stramonium]|uniref:Uncharacterized protein n=1 Tax=Datura stramonium TaxID=4076 RepID=A0ABS8RL73_DATST|nr:hypothetical protein [Datura stramonium]